MFHFAVLTMEEQERDEKHIELSPQGETDDSDQNQGRAYRRASTPASVARRQDLQEEKQEENLDSSGKSTTLSGVTTGIALQSIKKMRSIKHKSNSDDDGGMLSSGEELFEDEPDRSFPKASRNRLAARMERRKIARKQKQQSIENPTSLSKVGLPHFRAFKKENNAKDDDESSHWSSSDGEYGEENQRDIRWLSKDDIEICQKLDEEYERALEEREVVYTARYNSVRQSACFSVFFMLLYLTLGTIFFMRQAGWTVSQSIFFSIYTITTVGCMFLMV